MKSERRHEMKENELAHLLERGIRAAQPYSKAILGGAIIVLIGLVAFVIMNIERGVPRSPEWNSLYSAIDSVFRAGEDDVKRQEATAQLAELAERARNRKVGLWAALLAGEQQLAEAGEKAFSDPEATRVEIQRAIDQFQVVEREAQQDILKKKAIWNLAQAYELQATNESIEQGRAAYQRIVEEWPDSEMGRVAKQRISWLEDPEVIGPDGFYAWYRKQDFAALAAESDARMPSQFGPGQPFPGLDDPGQNLFDPTIPPEEQAPLFSPTIELEGMEPGVPGQPVPPATQPELPPIDEPGSDETPEPLDLTPPADDPGQPVEDSAPEGESPEPQPESETPAEPETPAETEPPADIDPPAEDPPADE